jgi:hypothetical protein
MLDTRKKRNQARIFRKKRIRQEVYEKEAGKKVKKKNQTRIQEQESCLVRHFLPPQTRFCLQEYHQKVQICFSRQESCIEGMAKES